MIVFEGSEVTVPLMAIGTLSVTGGVSVFRGKGVIGRVYLREKGLPEGGIRLKK